MSAAEKYRAIVAHADPREQQRIARLLEETKLFEVIHTTHDGTECVQQTVRCQPHLVIAEAILAGIDGLEVLHQIRSRCGVTKVLLLTSYSILLNNRPAMENADYCILAPYTDTVLVKRAIELVSAPEHTFSIQDILAQTTLTLDVIGAPRRLKGYPYVHDGIQLSVQDPHLIHRHTGPNSLYAQLCRRHNATYRNVERCMRSLSDHIFTHTNLTVLEHYFTQTDLARGRIGNLTLISTLAARITEELQAAARDTNSLSF